MHWAERVSTQYLFEIINSLTTNILIKGKPVWTGSFILRTFIIKD